MFDSKVLWAGVALVALAGAAAGQTVTVDTVEDVVDFAAPQTAAELPGPDGRVSMREAAMAATNTPGPQTIGFAIPQSEWWLVPNMALLRQEDGPYLLYDDETTVDFTTQTAFTGDTNPDGREVGIYGLEPNGWGSPAIIVQADDCVVRGLGNVWQRGSSVAIWSGQRNRIVGCVTEEVSINPYPTTSSFNIIGGTTPEDGNNLGEVNLLCGALDNVVIGNTIRSVGVSGSPYCDSPERNRIGGPTPEERNVIHGFGYYGEEGYPVGEGVAVLYAVDTLVEGNYIGTTADGMARYPQIGPTGVEVRESSNTTIRNNLISGLRVAGSNHYQGRLFGQAIHITAYNGDNHGVTIEGNLIGTDAAGKEPIPTLNGVVVSPVSAMWNFHGTRIGGTGPGQGNTIAFTERRGVAVHSLAEEVEISGNSIHSNGLLGIDLATNAGGYDGVTPNDPGDADTNGANGLQNFPVIDAAYVGDASVRVVGTLNSRPGRLYRLEFFLNSVCDPTGHGEGERFIGAHEVTTDADGNAAFEVILPAFTTGGELVTATATDVETMSTSEFSACAPVALFCPADFNADGGLSIADFTAFRQAFLAGDMAADFTGDRALGVSDFTAFRHSYLNGCP